MNSQTTKSKKTLIALILVFVLPVLGAKLVLSLNLYHGGVTNQGQLLDENLNYQALEVSNPKPHLWQMVYLLPTQCDDACTDRLYILNQSIIALGKERDRVIPIIFVDQDSDLTVLENMQVPFQTADVNEKIATQLNDDKLIIVDPLGSLVMQYSKVSGREENIAQGKAMISDLRKMLKLSRVG